MNMKYNYRFLLILLVAAVSVQPQSVDLAATSLRPRQPSTYTLQLNGMQDIIKPGMNINVHLPDSFPLETLQSKTPITGNIITFPIQSDTSYPYSWTIINPQQERDYPFHITILNQSQTIFSQTITVNISNRIRISQGETIDITISSSSPQVAANAVFTFTITPRNRSIPQGTQFIILFPPWSPLQAGNPSIENGNLRCKVNNSPVGCSGVVATGSGIIVSFTASIFSSILNDGSSLKLELENITNPSSTKPINIGMRVDGTVFWGSLAMTSPAPASNLTLSSTSNLTGVRLTTNLNFFGNLYYNGYFRIQFSSNINNIMYNNVSQSNPFNISNMSQSEQYSTWVIFPSYFSFTTPQYQSTYTITVTSYFIDTTDPSKMYEIETITNTYQVYPNSMSTVHSNIYLFTTSPITFNITLPFAINSATLLRLTFQNNASKLVCQNCTSGGVLEIAVNASQTVISIPILFQFNYFTSFQYKAQLFINTTYLSSQQTSSLSSYCGPNCKNCSISDPSICTECFTLPQSGKQFYYYSGYFRCYQTCPINTYSNSQSYLCIDCLFGCGVCQNSQSCITCNANYTRAANGTCISICGLSQYMSSSGVCQFCSLDCVRCLNSSYCMECNNETYLTTSWYCRQDCFGDCRTCDETRLKCTSCTTGYLYDYECYSQCPAGTVTIGTKCQSASNIIPFPFLIAFVVLSLALGCTKFFYPQTDLFGLIMVMVGICEVASAVATTIILLFNFEIFSKQITIIGVGLIVYLLANITFLVLYIIKLRKDPRFKEWMGEVKNKVTLYVFLVLSTIYSFKIFRGVYSRFFNLENFSTRFLQTRPLVPLTNLLTAINYLTFSALAIAGGVMTLALSPISYRGSQGYYLCIELITIQVLGFIFLVLDFKKPDDYFQKQAIKIGIENKHGTLQNIQTDEDNSKIDIVTKMDKSKSKSPKRDKSPVIKKPIPTVTMKGFQDKSAVGVNRKSLEKNKKGGKGKEGKTTESEEVGKEGRRGNRFNRKKRTYDTGSNDSFDIYLDFDHEPKQKSKEIKQYRTPKNQNYRSSELKPQTKSKLNPMADIYVGFLNSESEFNLNSSIDMKKNQEEKQANKPKIEIEPIKIVQRDEQPQIVIHLDQPVIKLPQPPLKQTLPQPQPLPAPQVILQKQQQSQMSPIKHLDKSKTDNQEKKEQQQESSAPALFSKTEGFNH